MIPTEAGPWVPSQTRVLIEFATAAKKFMGVTLRTYNSNKFFVVNKPKEKDFYKTRITFAEDAISKDSAWWKDSRQEPLTNLENEAYKMIDEACNKIVQKASPNPSKGGALQSSLNLK